MNGGATRARVTPQYRFFKRASLMNFIYTDNSHYSTLHEIQSAGAIAEALEVQHARERIKDLRQRAAQLNGGPRCSVLREADAIARRMRLFGGEGEIASA